MKNLIVAAVVSAFSLGAVAASHMEKGASAPMAKPMAAPAAAAPAASGAKKAKAAKHHAKKAASAA
jgi:hypothetical protein